ncbi:hypothetical protein JNUCC64_13665 [Streptomyces sp. JNUCC 64]
MRDRIARALVWVLTRLPLTRRTRPGRHTAAYLTHPEPAPTPEPAVSPARHRPWTGPSSAEAAAVFRAEEARYLPPHHRERFYAAAFAERGYDYPPARGVHQARPEATV